MAGLVCEACQEVTVVLQTCSIAENIDGSAVLPRHRTCTNQSCEFYLVRRISYEVMIPVSDNPLSVQVLHSKVSRLKKRP